MNRSFKKNLVFGTILLGATTIHAQVVKQKVGDNPTIISASTVLEVESTNKGVLLPRIGLASATDATTIPSPATSLLIYNTATAGTSPNDVAPGFYYWSGTRWNKLSVGSETDPVIGNEILDAVANGGLTRTGTGTAADPYKIKITDGTTNGQVLTWDGTKWTAAAAGAEVDGIIGNEVLNATTNKGLTRAGAGTNADPYTLGLTDGTAANQTMVWNGTTWAPATTPEVDGIIGNEVTDALVNGGLTRTGTGTAADPYKLKINDGSTNGQVLTWDGTKWTATAAGAEVDGIIGNEVVTATTNRGLERAGTGTNADPYTLGLTAGTTTGQVYKWDGTNWVPGTDAGLTAEVDGIIGNEVTDAVANGGLTRTGTGTAADPYKLKINDGSTNGQVLTWDGAKWVAAAAGAEVDGIIGNEVLNATTNKGLTRAGAGTNADPYTLGLTDGTAANQTMVWNGTTWAPATTPEVDGIIGNEVTDALVNGGLTRTGTGTAADPYKLKINDGSTNGQVLTWDGTKWVAAAASSDWKLLGNAGTTAGTNFIGTTDAIDFVTKTNNAEVMRATSAGNVGVGTATPTSKLQVSGSFALPLLNTAAAITLDATHATVRIDATTANVNVTLPAANTATGRIYKVIKADSTTNKLIFSATVLGNGFTFTEANVPGEYKIQSNGTNWYLLD